MEMKKTVLFLFIFFISVTTAFPCTCKDNKPYRDVTPFASVIVLVKVTRFLTYKQVNDIQVPMSMEAEIIEIYKGKERRRTVKIWGDNGLLCRPYLNKFLPGNYYVMGLFKSTGNYKDNVQEKFGDYWISICGEYTLEVDWVRKRAKGRIDAVTTELPLRAIKRIQ